VSDHHHLLRVADYLDPVVLERERERSCHQRFTYACPRTYVHRHQEFETR